MSATLMDRFAPLACFYADRGAAVPTPSMIDGADMPEPFRSLLVNRGDMTPTLERFHACTLRLRVLVSTQSGQDYRREVLLLDAQERPVEFGAIRIQLETLPPLAQEQVLAGQRPLGGVLIEHRVAHASQPSAYFTIIGDAVINQALGVQQPCRLYGRCNTLSTEDGRKIAEVVEILPPLRAPVQGISR